MWQCIQRSEFTPKKFNYGSQPTEIGFPLAARTQAELVRLDSFIKSLRKNGDISDTVRHKGYSIKNPNEFVLVFGNEQEGIFAKMRW
jgi:hypothetical protein